MAAPLEVGGWPAELDGLLARLGRLLVRAEPRGQAGRYLEGLLGPVRRKDGWQLAGHDLRHTAAATAASSGASLLVVGRLLGQ